METRKQHRGNCQCCGRQQAVLSSGLMSKHGYTVDNGWFEGVCSGQQYEPMQVSRAATDRIVSTIRLDCAKLQHTADAYRAGTSHPARIAKYSYRRGEDATMRWEDAASWEQVDGIKTAIIQIENRVRGGLAFADMLEQLANERHGQPLIVENVEAGPAPIQVGEKRKTPNGKILKATRLERGRVYWKDERGFGSWTGSSAWRKYEPA